MKSMKLIKILKLNSTKKEPGVVRERICPTLESAMGQGGGNVPLVVIETEDEKDES